MALWKTYSAGLPSASLELRVAQRALQDGWSAKEVTLMLVAGSETVRRVYEAQGKQQAMKYVAHIAHIAVQQQALRSQRKDRGREIEIGD